MYEARVFEYIKYLACYSHSLPSSSVQGPLTECWREQQISLWRLFGC